LSTTVALVLSRSPLDLDLSAVHIRLLGNHHPSVANLDRNALNGDLISPSRLDVKAIGRPKVDGHLLSVSLENR
jgi:hypothetical protein